MARTVLVVDDSAVIREVVSFTLSQAGFLPVEATDGKDALERAEKQRFDLVITDLNMPNLNGIQLIRALRDRRAFRHIPILMLTTESQDARKQEGRAAGATGWIVKPFRPDKLLQVIGRVLP